MRILMFNNPLTGHFLPLLPLARALRRQGHTAAFVAAAGMAGSVEPEGFELIPAGPAMDAVVAEVTRRTGIDMRVKPSPELVGEYFAGARVDLAVDEALAGAREWAPDLVVAEHCDFVGPLVAAVLKVPSAVMGIDPALEPDVLEALASTVRSRYLDRGLEAPAHAPSGRWLLDLCPPSLQRGGPLPALERIPLRPEPHQGPDGTPPAPRTPGTGRPRVLVSLSAVPGAAPALGPLLRSLSTLDVDLVATTGGAVVDDLGVEPGRVELVGFVPAAQLLDGVSAVVHHGGSGTTFGTAARGIPAVVVPGWIGQQRQAYRLRATGAGLALPVGEQAPESVTAAVGRLLTEPAFTTAARRLRDEIAEMPSASEVAERLTAAVSGQPPHGFPVSLRRGGASPRRGGSGFRLLPTAGCGLFAAVMNTGPAVAVGRVRVCSDSPERPGMRKGSGALTVESHRRCAGDSRVHRVARTGSAQYRKAVRRWPLRQTPLFSTRSPP